MKSFCVCATQIRNLSDCSEQCGEAKKGHLRCCCSQVGAMNGGCIPWRVTAISETFKVVSWEDTM